jgi:hypothetical protein
MLKVYQKRGAVLTDCPNIFSSLQLDSTRYNYFFVTGSNKDRIRILIVTNSNFLLLVNVLARKSKKFSLTHYF